MIILKYLCQFVFYNLVHPGEVWLRFELTFSLHWYFLLEYSKDCPDLSHPLTKLPQHLKFILHESHDLTASS